MFKKILIANRGEIACRVIETARRLGVRTVAVYSDADVAAKHVSMADEAYHLGPPAVSESYLLAAKIIDIALECGAEAIHPGYGFLSENPDFVEKVSAAGLRFIGPSADAIRAMGLKDAAKKLMEEAGVPVVPGYHGENQDPEYLAQQAAQIGYPVLIKARAGGGGKGMRRVNDPYDFATALAGAQREAQAAFGDAACLIEKYVTAPRHIEIQVFGDDYGNVVHLFERDCSLQRRHQKVIEEAPAPGMTDEMRAAMGQAATRAAQAIGYSGAGTVEFIVDASDGLRIDRFWFMEMNTRLQVEHPVTEAITGLDLVEWQLRVASGEPLPLAQADLQINGWAFEARIYAEDVPKGFLPATGTLEYLDFPLDARVDSGVRQGDAISPWYDPMIAKLVVHGPTRKVALNAMLRALEQTHVAGTVTNLSFLSALCGHAGFRDGSVDTGLIDRDLDYLLATEVIAPEARALAAIVGLGFEPLDRMSGWRLWEPASQNVRLGADDEVADCSVMALGSGAFRVRWDGAVTVLKIVAKRGNRYEIQTDARNLHLVAIRHGEFVTVFQQGRSARFAIMDPLAQEGGADIAQGAILSPMPGLIKLVSATAGQTVAKGDPLLVLEAMKMEHTLTAPRDGIVASVGCKVGGQVDAGVILLALEDEDA